MVKDQIFQLIELEKNRQRDVLEMIPSENYVSAEVLFALGSVLTNKYSEGYLGGRYYQGNNIIDDIEKLAIERAKQLFGVPHVNVQPYSGSPANAAVFMALVSPGEKVMGLKLSGGGHLTHGHPKITFSGRYYNSVQFDVNEDGWIDYDELEKLAVSQRPKLIVIGTTAYPRTLNFKRCGEIAEKVDAVLLADISHIAGLVVAGEHISPVPYAHVVMTTTHKTLRGPRGAMILVTEKGLQKIPDMIKKIDGAVFPGLQGGPHDNTTAAIAVALDEAMRDEFKVYIKQIVVNAKVLADELLGAGFKLTTGGTDNHLMVIDLRGLGIGGKDFAIALEKAGIVTNCNTVPHDSGPPRNPSGVRLGTPAITSRGMSETEMKMIAKWIARVRDDVGSDEKLKTIAGEVRMLCEKFPAPGI